MNMSSTWRSKTWITPEPRQKVRKRMELSSASTRLCLTSSTGLRSEKKIYGSIAELQADLDDWIRGYNIERPPSGRWCFGKTPMQTFLDAKPLAQEKSIAA